MLKWKTSPRLFTRTEEKNKDKHGKMINRSQKLEQFQNLKDKEGNPQEYRKIIRLTSKEKKKKQKLGQPQASLQNQMLELHPYNLEERHAYNLPQTAAVCMRKKSKAGGFP